MTDRFNTIAGWVLFAGIVLLGSSILAGEVFHAEAPHEGGYPIPGVVRSGEAAEEAKPIEFYLASADLVKGEQAFKKCAACHNVDPGGANALGPALYGVMGNPVAGHAGFAYSDALKSKGGSWDWNTMSEWIANPKKFAPGTKMTFAGISDPQERANLLAFLNSRDNAPLPAPAAPAEATAAAPTGEAGGGAQVATKEPVPTDPKASEKGGGEAAPHR